MDVAQQSFGLAQTIINWSSFIPQAIFGAQLGTQVSYGLAAVALYVLASNFKKYSGALEVGLYGLAVILGLFALGLVH